MLKSNLVRYLISFAFMMHGLGMAGGSYFVFAQPSWFLSAVGGGKITSTLVTVLWVVSGIAFLGAAWFFFRGSDLWRTWAMVAAPVSLVGIILWAGAIPPGTYVGAILDVAVIIALLWLK